MFFLILLFLPRQVPGQGLPTAKPEDAGLSSTRLARIKPVMQGYVDRGKLAGLMTMVARQGKVVHFETYGRMDTGKEMRHDTIFRIASMTKPVTSVAVMMLYEEGYFQLYDPVSKFIPEFKKVKVFSKMDRDKPVLVEPKRPMTIRDLLTHTSGLTYGFFGKTPVNEMYRSAGLYNGTLKEMIPKLSELPLLYQPGTRWHYSMSTDVLGYLVEVISGKPLDEFLEERIFKPLKMKDTGFYVPKEKLNRFAARYGLKDGHLKVIEKPGTSNKTKAPKFLSGGGGLLSTAPDYIRFAQMLLNKGQLEGVRILGRKTVELMTMNHLPDEFLPIHPVLSGKGFGLGFAVLVDVPRFQITGSEGEFEWRGIYNTFFWVDPAEELVAILMTQFSPYLYYPVHDEFRVLTYQAIIAE
ncbi:MAG: serine hydrolase [bacterium]|nr:serine hydrolase [bacterium]